MFKSPQTSDLFGKHFLADLKDVLSRLHNRNERNKILPPDFWIVDRALTSMVEGLPFHKLTKLVSHTLLENCP